jgi:superfamily II DNA or RNA helicase
MTDAALRAESDLAPWVFAHTTQPDSYPKLEMPAPTVWRLRDEGRFHTSRGLRPAALTVHPSLHEWAQFLPVAKCEPAVAALLGLSETLDSLSNEIWLEAVSASFEIVDDAAVGRLYATACSHIDAPARLRCRRRDGHAAEPPESVSAVASKTEFDALVAQDVPTILAPTVEDADALRVRWGLNTEQKVETNLAYGVAGAEAPLTDRFPSLQWQLEPEQRDLVLVPCSELRLETITASGRTADNLTVYLDDGRIFYDEQLDERTLLLSLAPLLELELDEQDADVAIAKRREVERRRRIEEIKKQSTPEERLLAALGEAPLRSRLPRGLLAALEADGRTLGGKEIGELALAVYGVDVLRVFRSELEDAGLEPPRQWAGSQAALKFVRRIGFPREFAGFEHPRRSPLLEVEGPPNVPDLHTYQREIVDGLRSLLRGDLDGRRAMISLPTGAGKTRVAVEAIIEALQHDGLTGPILWVAQSDELCEQAVQTWSFVWRGLGPAREPLAISRLWGSNEAEPSDTPAHVVVAGIQKLQAGCIKDPEYAWLAEANCVVIDEAHHSTAPSYTELLDWLGLGRQKQSRPLVGLTATPYRGVSEVETDRLVKRYGTRRLDSIAFGDENPYPILQREGVLAGVEHRLMKGTDVVLDAKELEQISRLRVLPPRAEEELGRSVDRNRRLLAEVLRLPEDWTILLFATSVDHAQTMAALLTLEGVTAKPITGLTDDGPRRHYIEEFREGRIRVLTNYNVLTQGFDAPAVRAVIVARPTFSPNLYQQMIGRGLRGPLNGGKETCLIVNVEDNVVAYGDDLAFREFEYLWNPDGTTP